MWVWHGLCDGARGCAIFKTNLFRTGIDLIGFVFDVKVLKAFDVKVFYHREESLRETTAFFERYRTPWGLAAHQTPQPTLRAKSALRSVLPRMNF